MDVKQKRVFKDLIKLLCMKGALSKHEAFTLVMVFDGDELCQERYDQIMSEVNDYFAKR